MIIEMLGAPGAGKTTALEHVIDAVAAHGQEARTVETAARPLMERTLLGRLVGRLGRFRDPALWRLFALRRLAFGYLEMVRRPRLTILLARSQLGRPSGADVRARRVWRWFVRALGTNSLLRRLGTPGEVYVVDEGLCHRTVQLFSSSVETPDDRWIPEYVRSIPAPDLVVYVRAGVEACQARVETRGTWGHWQHRTSDQIDTYVANAHTAATLTAEHSAASGIRLLVFENGDSGADWAALASQVGDQLG